MRDRNDESAQTSARSAPGAGALELSNLSPVHAQSLANSTTMRPSILPAFISAKMSLICSITAVL